MSQHQTTITPHTAARNLWQSVQYAARQARRRKRQARGVTCRETVERGARAVADVREQGQEVGT